MEQLVTDEEVLAEARELVLADQVADRDLCFALEAALGRARVRDRGTNRIELTAADSADFRVLVAGSELSVGPLPWAFGLALRLPLGTPARVHVTRLP